MVPVHGVAEDILSLPVIRDAPFRALLLPALQILLLILLYIASRRLLARLLRGTTEAVAAREESQGNQGRAVRLRTLGRLSDGLILWTLSFIFGVTILSTLGVNVAGIVGTAGVAGVAFGFGAQKLAKDTITGFFILLEDQYAVGEYVTIGTVSGVVKDIGLRTTRLMDDDGKTHYFSNGDIATVANHSRGPVSGNFEISVAASADPEVAQEAIRAALAAQIAELGLDSEPTVDGITATDAAKTTLRVLFQSPPGQRQSNLIPKLREVARKALVDAEIPLG